MRLFYLLLPIALAVGVYSQVRHPKAIKIETLPSTREHYISVKVLDAESGRPVKGIWVPLDDKTELKQILNAKTNPDGIAEFHLSDPVPERIGISFSPREFGSCSEVEFLTDRILKTGIVAGNTCKSSKANPSFTPETGQLVVFGKRVMLWQRVLQEVP